ncbi:tryptophan---tRNA ligase [Synchytrium endobioticum]|uniref:Tryptophan--tRNA ligase, cytoplasmic n=1 Tax=Synchytrium endobioticum TaxID=286115 RepID=A0A507DIE8_9FUNG|nr:tryptophan---tRNA ligase [Synchytrium endobioticum]TPX50620.1 tryptophan---tRNA ligase [Synchytrium endobioticum]
MSTENHSDNGAPTASAASSSEAPPGDATSKAQLVTPWDVQGQVVHGKQKGIDYDRLIQDFGTQRVSPDLLTKLETLTGKKPHRFLTRNLFFSHRELDVILDRFEKGKPFYLYTGRGPSSDSMHVGHLVPFIFCKYLQEAFDVPLVIQMTDDEKFLFKEDLKLEDTYRYTMENAKDIISIGFDPSKTFIFSNLDYVGQAFYRNVVKISKCVTTSVAKATFGFTDSDNVGKLHFVAIQASPSFSNSFPQIFGPKGDVPCLIPCAIDQDPYFRLTRDAAKRLKYPKPSLIHSKFFPALQGPGTKMSASVANSAIFITDTRNQIKNKINRHAFSGGGATAELHREHGGDTEVDVAYQYLTFFLDNDQELGDIEKRYKSGDLSTGDLKKRCIEVVADMLEAIQARRKAITDDELKQFMDPNFARPFHIPKARTIETVSS